MAFTSGEECRSTAGSMKGNHHGPPTPAEVTPVRDGLLLSGQRTADEGLKGKENPLKVNELDESPQGIPRSVSGIFSVRCSGIVSGWSCAPHSAEFKIFCANGSRVPAEGAALFAIAGELVEVSTFG